MGPGPLIPAGPRGGILCVDDDETVLLWIQAWLGRRREVFTAASGLSGLQKMVKHRPDWVVIDYDMPGMDGIQFMLQARKLGFRPGFILLTALEASDLDWGGIGALGLKGLLRKPLDPDTLLAILEGPAAVPSLPA